MRGEGVKSQNSLINEFKKIYRRLAKVQTKQDLEGKNWKEVLNIKFNEVVKVKRVNDVLSPQNEAENENNFKKINEEVKNGNLQQALDGCTSLTVHLSSTTRLCKSGWQRFRPALISIRR